MFDLGVFRKYDKRKVDIKIEVTLPIKNVVC
jgi:hypothetical protein